VYGKTFNGMIFKDPGGKIPKKKKTKKKKSKEKF
jgi:hypothetical protein